MHLRTRTTHLHGMTIMYKCRVSYNSKQDTSLIQVYVPCIHPTYTHVTYTPIAPMHMPLLCHKYSTHIDTRAYVCVHVHTQHDSNIAHMTRAPPESPQVVRVWIWSERLGFAALPRWYKQQRCHVSQSVCECVCVCVRARDGACAHASSCWSITHKDLRIHVCMLVPKPS